MPEAGREAVASLPPQPTKTWRDIGRAACCALVVVVCVHAPAALPYLAPIVPLLGALRLLRGDGRTFLLATMAGSVMIGALLLAPVDLYIIGLLIVLASVLLGLAWIHARAARPDTSVSDPDAAWPEPRLDGGLSLAVGGWCVATVLAMLALVPGIGGPRALSELGVETLSDAYAVYVEACAPKGVLAAEAELCAELMMQRDAAIDLVEQWGISLVAAVLGLLATATAASVHLLVLNRARANSGLVGRVRQRFRPGQLEVHWSAAYLTAAGVIGLLIQPGSNVVLETLRASALGLGAVGASLLAAHGFGLVCWTFGRGRSPVWYRVMLAVLAMLFSPLVVTALFLIGILDMGLRPRRRTTNSGSLPGRGSGG